MIFFCIKNFFIQVVSTLNFFRHIAIKKWMDFVDVRIYIFQLLCVKCADASLSIYISVAMCDVC